MVRIEEKKITIEISTSSPLEDFVNLNKALADSIYNMDDAMLYKDVIGPIILLIKAMQPEYEQLDEVRQVKSDLPLQDTFLKKMDNDIGLSNVYNLLDEVIFECIDKKMTGNEYGKDIADQIYDLKLIRDAFKEFAK